MNIISSGFNVVSKYSFLPCTSPCCSSVGLFSTCINESIEYPFGLVAVFFEKNKSKVSRSFYTKLEELSSYVEENPNFKIKVSGYADSATGNTSLNQALSIQRVQSVVDVLIEMGVSPDLFEINPMGETLLFSQSLYDLNRRVDVELIINEE